MKLNDDEKKRNIHFFKDLTHLYKLESEYKTLINVLDSKHEEYRKWIQFMSFTYPQFDIERSKECLL